MVNKKTDIKATAIVRIENSEEYLFEILESIKELSEIIVLDYNSTDDSIEIAKEYKAKIIYCEKNNNNSLDEIINQASNDWILVIDKNEILPKNLLIRIKEYIDNPANKNIATLAIKKFYLNKEVKFLQEKKQIRLFKKGLCSLDYDYKVRINNKTNQKKDLKVYSINKNLKTPNEYILKFINNNITDNLKDIIDNNKNKLKNLNSNLKQNPKPSIIIKPILVFFKYYLQKGGILEGRIGFLLSKIEYIKSLMLETMILENNFKGDKYDIR